MIKKILKKIYISTSPDKYDLKHLGTFSFLRRLFYNLFSPGRIYNRYKFNQISNFKNIQSLEKITFEKNYNISDEVDKKLLDKAYLDLFNNGGCVIDGYFNSDTIESFKKNNENLIENFRKIDSNEISYRAELLQLNPLVCDLWLDKNLMNLIKLFFQKDFYARNYPYMVYTHVPNDSKKEEKSKVADSWHLDHSTLFNLHILLEDVTENDTCMEILPGSHKYLNISSLYSDKVAKEFSQKTIKCFGKKGTIYMHTGNAVHRLNPIKGSNRLNLHFEFSAGSNIFLDSENIKNSLSSKFNLYSLDENRKKILKVIYPQKERKGYDFKKGKIYPTNFKGI